MNTSSTPQMPGSFPSRVETLGKMQAYVMASELVDESNRKEFVTVHFSSKVFAFQQHIISQVDSLAYLIIGYQLVKYCHLACLLPALCHIGIQRLLNCNIITHSSSETARAINEVIEGIARRRNESRSELGASNNRNNSNTDNFRDISRSKREILDAFMKDACWVIYFKSIFTFFYHFLFLYMWMIPIADKGELKSIENGTWWFVSFLGESTNISWEPSASIWLKFYRVGIIGLLLSDILILFMQLVLFQCIYRQSNIFPPTSEESSDLEYVIKVPGSSFNRTLSREKIHSSPYVLLVKLFELLNYESFTLRA